MLASAMACRLWPCMPSRSPQSHIRSSSPSVSQTEHHPAAAAAAVAAVGCTRRSTARCFRCSVASWHIDHQSTTEAFGRRCTRSFLNHLWPYLDIYFRFTRAQQTLLHARQSLVASEAIATSWSHLISTTIHIDRRPTRRRVAAAVCAT